MCFKCGEYRIIYYRKESKFYLKNKCFFNRLIHKVWYLKDFFPQNIWLKYTK